MTGPSDANPASGGARVRAVEALEYLEHLSAEINKSWQEEKRFHFQVLEVPPVLLVKMSFRNRATFSVFATPQLDPYSKPANLWQAIGAEDDHRYTRASGHDSLEFSPLHRGPAKRARFLVEFGFAGCGTGWGVGYYAYEWDPQNSGDLSEFIKLEGSVSQEEPASGGKTSESERLDLFSPIGNLQTHGPLITLPYCWFSAIDTWDNPSLCAVNTYDLSGDHVQFICGVVNRPDLLPIAKAIQYAQAHDYPAVLAYCGSPDVARQMMRDIPPFVFAGSELRVKRIGDSKESIEMEDTGFHFEVEKRGDRWLVVSFRMD